MGVLNLTYRTNLYQYSTQAPRGSEQVKLNGEVKWLIVGWEWPPEVD